MVASPLLGLPTCCNVFGQVRGIWGLGGKKKWLSGLVHLLELGLSCCSAYQPQNILLERRASGPLGKESISSGQLFSGRHSLIPLLVVSNLFDKLVWHSHSIRNRINLSGLSPVTRWGNGEHLGCLASCLRREDSRHPAAVLFFQCWVLKPAHLLLITFQGPYLVVSCFISGIHNCDFNRAGRKNMSIPFLWTRSLCLLYF